MDAQVIIDDSFIRQVSSCSRSICTSLHGSGLFLLGNGVIENFAGRGIGEVGE